MKTLNLKNWNLFVLAGCLSTGYAGIAQAQGPAIAQPIANWSYIDHSSTLIEGSLRGQAAVIESAGQAVYLDSLAAVNYAEAYKRAIENSVAVTKAYYERREIREEYNQKYGPKAFVGEARKKFIEYYAPKRLSAQEFDLEQGKLTWPHILRQEQFAPVKEQIDLVFARRNADNSGDGSKTHREVLQLCTALTGLMRENIGTMSSDQYINALEFIRSVELEAKTTISADLKAAPAVAEESKLEEAKLVEPKAAEAPVKTKDSDTTSIERTAVRTKA